MRSMVIEATQDSQTLEHERNNFSKFQSTETDRGKKYGSQRSGDGKKQADAEKHMVTYGAGAPISPRSRQSQRSNQKHMTTVYNSIQ